MAERTRLEAHRKRGLTRSWLEEQGRLLSPEAIMLRFVLVMACLGAIELGRREGLAFGVALLWHGQCYQWLVLGRIRSNLLEAPEDSDDKRPFRVRDGWLDVNWRLRGILHHTARMLTTALVAMIVLYLDPRVGIMALVVCLALTEATGVMMARVVDQLVQVEVERRVDILRGISPARGSGRGDFRSM